MDLSKLPGRPARDDASSIPDPAATPPLTAVSDASDADETSAAPPPRTVVPIEHWRFSPFALVLDLLLGAWFVYLGLSFASWAVDHLTGQPFHTGVNWTSGDAAGQEVPYFDLEGGTAWTNMSLFVMGVALLGDAVLLLAGTVLPPVGRSILIWLAIVVTLSAAIVNLVVCFVVFHLGVFPQYSALAVVIGLWIALDQYRLLPRPQPASSKRNK